MNKKITSALVLTMAATMSLGLVGCGNKTEEKPPVDNPPVVEDQNTPSTPEVETPGTETPDVETPEVVSVSMDDVVNTLKNTYGERYLPSMPLDQDTFNMMVGLTSDMYSEFYAEMPMMSTHADRLFIVKTDKVDDVKAVFDTYKQSLIDDTMQYPMNIAKIENSEVYVKNDYVMFFMLGGYTDEEPAGAENMTPEQVEEAVEAMQTAYYVEQMGYGLNALDKLFLDGIVPEPTAPEVTDETVTDETVTEENTEVAEGEDVNTAEPVADVVDETSTEVDGTVTDGEPTEGSEENTTEEASDVETPAEEVTANN